jgi:ribonuclease P protein subunit RPR2
MRRTKKPDWQQRIARERIQILFDLAEKEFKKHPERSKRYVELARKMGLRYNIRLPKELKKKFCKNCSTLLKPGLTSEIRIRNKILTIRCKICNKIYRHRVK